MMTAYPKLALALALAIAVLAGGFIGGRALKPAGETSFEFDLDSPAYEASLAEPGLSKGGFGGFGEDLGLEGATLLSGRITAISPEEITIELSRGTLQAVRVGETASVTQLEASSRDALSTGFTVVILTDAGEDTATAILIIAEP